MDKHGRFKGQLPMDVSGLYTIFQNAELTADMKKNLMIQIFTNEFLIDVLLVFSTPHFSPQLKTKHTKFYPTTLLSFELLSSFLL